MIYSKVIFFFNPPRSHLFFQTRRSLWINVTRDELWSFIWSFIHRSSWKNSRMHLWHC